MNEATNTTETAAEFAAAVESSKLQALYNFAYGLSHEINNPLANISARAQSLLGEEKNPERRRKLATIVQQAFRAHEMIADLMLFARPPTMRREAIDLVKLADTVVAEVQEQADEQGTRVVRGGDSGPLMATVDRTQIAVALKALIQNSLDALRQGGEVQVCGAQDTGLRETLLTITDTGPGIPPEIRQHIFDPFFSGREAGRGLGLGLSKAWRIVELHGGSIHVESDPGHGATFIIRLPAASD